MCKLLYNFFELLNHPFRSSIKYTALGIALSLLLSVLNILVVWFVNTPMFDLLAFMKNIWHEIVVYNTAFLILIVAAFLLWSFFSKKTIQTIICAFAIKFVSASYMCFLFTVSLSNALIDSGWFENETWLNYLPYNGIYPMYSSIIIISMWAYTWYFALHARMKGKKLTNNPSDRDLIDVATNYLKKCIKHCK